MIGLERWASSIIKPVQNFKIQIGVPWSGLERHRNHLSLSLSHSRSLYTVPWIYKNKWHEEYEFDPTTWKCLLVPWNGNIEIISDIYSLSNSERQESSGICCTSWYLLVRISCDIWIEYLECIPALKPHWSWSSSLLLFFSCSRWRKHCWHAFLDGNGSAFQVLSQISQKII